MTSALIGFTGFVGGAILRHQPFDECFRSTNIDSMRGKTFDRVVCAGAPAEKWRANKAPEADRDQLATLMGALADVEAKEFVLISTVDVYPVPRGVDENTPIDPSSSEPYGRHRYQLEEFCRSRHQATVVRLPGMYGTGLKKNAIYDLLNHRPVDGIPGNARFQFYDVDLVWRDVERVLAAGVRTANITAEPVSMSEVAEKVFGRALPLAFSEGAASYDVRSLYAGLAGGHAGYWYNAAESIEGLAAFVARERAK